MKRIILLIVLVALIALHAPWRLMALAAEVAVMSPGQTHVSQDDDRYWDALDLEAKLETLHWGVGYTNGLEFGGYRAYGITDPSKHTIVIDESLHWNARFAVLAHEAGHTLQPGWVTRGQAEAFAESVAMIFCDDGVREHARYLADDKIDFFVIAIVEWRAIYHAAALLEDR